MFLNTFQCVQVSLLSSFLDARKNYWAPKTGTLNIIPNKQSETLQESSREISSGEK
jgi:hypothetical protein